MINVHVLLETGVVLTSMREGKIPHAQIDEVVCCLSDCLCCLYFCLFLAQLMKLVFISSNFKQPTTSGGGVGLGSSDFGKGNIELKER